MKKAICLLLALTLALSCFCLGAGAAAFAAKDSKVQYVLAKETEKRADGTEKSTTYTYDDAGRNTKAVYKETSIIPVYDENGKLLADTKIVYTRTTTEEYDSKGKAVSELIKDSDGYWNSSKCTYNAKGNITKKVFKESRGLTRTTTYTYDSKGRITKQAYKVTGGDSGSTAYTYDSAGRVSKTVYKEDGYTETTKNTYDSGGKLTKYVMTGSNGYNVTALLKYDDKGRKILDSQTATGDELWELRYKYDSNGNLIKFTSVDNGGIVQQTDSTYNSNGLLIKELKKSREEDDQAVYTYTYNSRGDKTKAVCRIGGRLHSTTTYTYKKLASPATIVVRGDISVRLSRSYYTYDGKAKCPSVDIHVISSEEWYFLLQGPHYSVTYHNNVGPGKAKLVIRFTEPYFYGSPITITYNIRPAKVTGLKASSVTKTSAALTWTKVAGAEKYIVYKYISSTNKYVKAATVTGTKVTIKSLKSATAYKFCVKAVGGGLYSASYSAKLAVKTK